MPVMDSCRPCFFSKCLGLALHGDCLVIHFGKRQFGKRCYPFCGDLLYLAYYLNTRKSTVLNLNTRNTKPKEVYLMGTKQQHQGVETKAS